MYHIEYGTPAIECIYCDSKHRPLNKYHVKASRQNWNKELFECRMTKSIVNIEIIKNRESSIIYFNDIILKKLDMMYLDIIKNDKYSPESDNYVPGISDKINTIDIIRREYYNNGIIHPNNMKVLNNIWKKHLAY